MRDKTQRIGVLLSVYLKTTLTLDQSAGVLGLHDIDPGALARKEDAKLGYGGWLATGCSYLQGSNCGSCAIFSAE